MCMGVCIVAQLCLFVIPWTIALCPWDFPGMNTGQFSPPDLPNPGTEPMSPALAGGFFTFEPPRKQKSDI